MRMIHERRWLLTALTVSIFFRVAAQTLNDYTLTSVPFTSVRVDDAFWAPRIDTNRANTVSHVLQQCETTGRIKNFLKAAGTVQGMYEGWWFNDSDVYKSIEAAAYSLMLHPDPQLDRQLDDMIATIASAQEADGYLFGPRKTTDSTYRYFRYIGTERWMKEQDSHELYCLGHLFEAAVAHYRATGKKSLLDVALKSAELVLRVFGPGKNRLVPGHQEIEVGLVKLYRVTGDERYARLAKFFLDERGRADGHKLYGEYSQDHKPVIDQSEAVGHAVRALYMYSGMTDIVALFGDKQYAGALDRLWEDVVGRKIYLTGGIGAAGGHEGFSDPYELPNRVAYCETCAAIANMLWNHRMFLLYNDGKYMDVLERTLYNAMLSGVAFEGRTFFYDNPLESDGRHSRRPWFAVACCPPNVARIMPQIAGMAYASNNDNIYVNLFIGGIATIPVGGQDVILKQQTGYPWNGSVKLTVDPAHDEKEFTLHVRVPGWARNEALPGGLYRFVEVTKEQPTLRINGKSSSLAITKDYAEIRRRWMKGDVVELTLPMPLRRVESRAEVKANTGRVALQRGPIVYCVEWPDVKDGNILNLVLPDETHLAVRHRPEFLNGITAITGTTQGLYCTVGGGVQRKTVEFTAIPYYAWAHRGTGEMAVWLARDESAALPVPCPTTSSTAKATSSGGDAKALNDLREPKSSTDHTFRYLHWWPKKATSEWVQYDFETPTKLSAAEVYWFDDTGIGECRIPKSWQLLYRDGRDGEEWKPVRAASGYGIEKDRYNRTTFEPVLTSGLRLVVALPDSFSTGIHEWRVNEK